MLVILVVLLGVLLVVLNEFNMSLRLASLARPLAALAPCTPCTFPSSPYPPHPIHGPEAELRCAVGNVLRDAAAPELCTSASKLPDDSLVGQFSYGFLMIF